MSSDFKSRCIEDLLTSKHGPLGVTSMSTVSRTASTVLMLVTPRGPCK